jgi:hypothetical protein
MPILKSELLQGRDKTYPNDYTQQISDNLDSFLIPMNGIRNAYGIPMIVNSGWRPSVINKSDGGAPNSKHLVGLACDISDVDGKLWAWVLQNLPLMQTLNIFLEDKRWTSSDIGGGWCHFQLGGPKSGKRIFIPNNSQAPNPNIWDGVYDKKFDVAVS